MEKWFLFVGIGLAVLLAFFALFGKRLFSRPSKEGGRFSVDSLVGTKGVVTEKVENIAGSGSVSAGGYSFAARALSDEEIYEPGENVEIVAVEGVKLICRTVK